MSTAEAAARLNITEQHVRRLVRDGTLPAERSGKLWVLPDDLDEHYAKGKHTVKQPVEPVLLERLYQLLIIQPTPQDLDLLECMIALTLRPDAKVRVRYDRYTTGPGLINIRGKEGTQEQLDALCDAYNAVAGRMVLRRVRLNEQ